MPENCNDLNSPEDHRKVQKRLDFWEKGPALEFQDWIHLAQVKSSFLSCLSPTNHFLPLGGDTSVCRCSIVPSCTSCHSPTAAAQGKQPLGKSTHALACCPLCAMGGMAGRTYGVGKCWKTLYSVSRCNYKDKASTWNPRQRISTLIWYMEETESIFHIWTWKICVPDRKLVFLFVQPKSQLLTRGFPSEKFSSLHSVCGLKQFFPYFPSSSFCLPTEPPFILYFATAKQHPLQRLLKMSWGPGLLSQGSRIQNVTTSCSQDKCECI